MYFNGSGSCYKTRHHEDIMFNVRDTLRPKRIQNASFELEGLDYVVPISGNIISEPGRLKLFNYQLLLTGPDQVDAVKTTFYDTSGVPTGTEPRLFGTTSCIQKVQGSTAGKSTENIMFPEEGLTFTEGIGFISEAIIGNPILENVNVIVNYVKEEDMTI